MKRKIAVIATEYIKAFLQSMLGDLDVDYCIFTYKTFSDIQYIYEFPCCDAVGLHHW